MMPTVITGARQGQGESACEEFSPSRVDKGVTTVKGFKNATIEELATQQVRFAPPSRRLRQLARAETLVSEIEAGKQYPYPYICFRITDFRPDANADVMLSGDDLKHDLFQFISELAKSIPPMPVEKVAEPVLSMEDISKRFNVSTKTINRWRRTGLIGVPIVLNGRRQVGFLPSLVEPFLEANRTRVDRGGRFTKLSAAEKHDIVRRAKRLATAPGGTLAEVSRRIARRLNRSEATIRSTIKNHDRKHPSDAIYPTAALNLDLETKQAIYTSYRRGISVDTLARQLSRNRAAVYRAITEMRARRLLDQPLDYIANSEFDDRSLDAAILAPMPNEAQFEENRLKMRAPKDTPPELAGLYEAPLLTKEQEQHLFRQMNYLKHKAARLRAKLDPTRARPQAVKQIEEIQARANAVKARLISCNMRLVVSVAKKHAAHTDNFFELLSDGNMSLIRAVEKFDYSRGNKFSTYATWAIVKNFARTIPEEKRRRERYTTGHEDIFEDTQDNRTDEQECLAVAEQNSRRVNRLLGYLDVRERQIICMRAGLDNSEGMTLGEIGEKLGITKERVRQINVKSMQKLRGIARDKRLEQ
jgi:RNA polymerase sigma factor (sigma-70 family)